MGIGINISTAIGRGGGAAAPSSLLTSLAAYWKMDEASGNRAASAGGFTLTDNNTVTSAAGKQSNAASFAGVSSESLSVASAAALQGGARDFWFDLWFYPTSVTGVQFLISKGTASSGAGHEFSLFLNGTALNWRMSAGATVATHVAVVNPQTTINTWHYIAVWYVASTGLLWSQWNNNAAISSALVGTPNTTAAVLSLGAFNAASSFYTGLIDEVGRWNRAPTGAELLARYNGGAGNTYPF